MPSTPISTGLVAELQRTETHHQAGRLDRAETFYHRIIKKALSLAEPAYRPAGTPASHATGTLQRRANTATGTLLAATSARTTGVVRSL